MNVNVYAKVILVHTQHCVCVRVDLMTIGGEIAGDRIQFSLKFHANMHKMYKSILHWTQPRKIDNTHTYTHTQNEPHERTNERT